MSILFTQHEIARYYAVRFPGIQQSKRDEWRGKCPIHRGDGDNFAVDSTSGQAYCHSQCNRGWDIISLEQEITGRDFKASKAEVFSILGRPDEANNSKTREIVYGTLDKIYDYTDEHGEVLYQVLRYRDPKRFLQRRPDSNGRWINNLGDVRIVPYRLPEMLGSDKVLVVEGERDVDTLATLGLTATCNNGGAGNFKPELVKHFRGKTVSIIPDNDDPGRQHAHKVARMLHGTARSIKILEIPNLPPKGDVTDFVEAGGTVADLRQIYSETPRYIPQIECEDDRYVRTFRQEFDLAGGMEPFWDMSLQKGIPTPWERLTTALGGGLLNGEVYAIGAATGHGKTSLGLQFTIAALRAGYGVLVYSMEMGWRQVLHRLCGIEARVDLNVYRDLQSKGGLTQAMRIALAHSTAEFIDLPLAVSRKPEVTPDYIVEESRRLKSKLPKLDLIIVDHMQLMSSDGQTKTEYEKFTAISRATKQAAVELNVPALLMSQVSRNAAHERRAELEMCDLRGCLAADSLVLLADGRRTPIYQVSPGDVVLGLNEQQKLVSAPVSAVWMSGVQPVFRMRTRLGREIIATGNHPFRTPNGWTELKDLKPGDDLAGVLNAEIQGRVATNLDACRFAGYMAGNGSYIHNRGISFTTPDGDVLGDFEGIVSRMFPPVEIRKEQFANHYEVDLVRVFENGYGKPNGNPVRTWLNDSGMTGRFDVKRVPQFVYDMGVSGACEFLSGYLMTDGCIKAGRAYSVCFDTTSKGLAEDVQHLLVRLGVASVVGPPVMNSKSTVPLYRVSVVRQKANTARLLKRLTLFGKNKRKAAAAVAEFLGVADANSFLLALPNSYSRRVSATKWQLWRNTDKRIGRGKAHEIGSLLGEQEFVDWSSSDVVWDIVESIQARGVEETWDMRVPGVHSFTANDFIVHNSGAIEEDLAGGLLLYPDREDVEQAKQQGRLEKGPVKCWLKLGKARYGSSGLYMPLIHWKYCTRFDEYNEADFYQGIRAVVA